MKKLFCLLLVTLSLTACGVSEPVQETVEQLPDGSYIVTGLENAPGNDKSISPENEELLCISIVNEDGNLERAFISLSDAQYKKLQEALAAMDTVTYPKLIPTEDGSWKVIQVDKNGIPVDVPEKIDLFELLGDLDIRRVEPIIENHLTYPTLRLTEDGNLAVVIMSRDGTPVERTKTATKVSRFYSAEGKLQWTIAITATFTYNGLEVKCSDVSTKVTIADPDNWYLISEETDGTQYRVCFGRTTLGVTTSAPTFEVFLNCDRQGNLS